MRSSARIAAQPSGGDWDDDMAEAVAASLGDIPKKPKGTPVQKIAKSPMHLTLRIPRFGLDIIEVWVQNI